ncbi:MAG: ABC transporter permease [Terracidiphilus sp.]|jgi:putative ABC transport system permease protein
MALIRRMVNLFRRGRVDGEIEAELKSHIEMRIEENVAAGMTAEEARRDAMVRFGNHVVMKERVAAADASLGFGSFWRNVRFALRQLRRSPGFALTAILTLALGIGPTVAIFSIIWATFFAPLSYPHPEQLVLAWTHYKGERSSTLADVYAQYAAQSRSFERLDFESWRTLHLTNPDHTEDETVGLPVTPGNVTKTMGLRLAMGRDFLPDEGLPGKDHVVILKHKVWIDRYHSDPNIIGKYILIQDQPYLVVGVVQAGPPDRAGVPFMVPVIIPPGVHSSDFGNVIGRLKPGVTIAQAQAELSLIDQRLLAQSTERKDPQSWAVSVEQLHNDWLDHKLERNLWLLLASVGLVLLIACTNVANLLLARGSMRRQEIAVRAALGATRRQIFAQLLAESLTLALIGGAIGIPLGWGLMKFSLAIFPELAIQTAETVIEINLPVLVFAFVMTLIAGVLFGCAPGWQTARVSLSDTLKQGSRSVGGHSRTPVQAVLVTAEIALALVLLAGAGMAMHSFWNLSHIDLGFAADHVVTGYLQPRNTAIRGGVAHVPSTEEMAVRNRELLAQIRAVPGVKDAALCTNPPLHGFGTVSLAIVGEPYDQAHPPIADLKLVTPSYFHTLGIHIAGGRILEEGDGLGSVPVVVVNETFVRRYLPRTDPLSKQILLGGQDSAGHPSSLSLQIVGIFHDVMDDEHVTGTVQPEAYVSLWQIPVPYLSFVARTAIDPAAVTSALRRTIQTDAQGLTLNNVELMQTVVDNQRAGDRFGMILFGSFAGVALLLAAVGIYGVMAFWVVQRTHEIGLRMALGAERRSVVFLVVRKGMNMAIAGIALGLLAAAVLGRLLHSTLYGVGELDIDSLVGVAALLLGVAVFACWLPARRSAAIDPMQALRNE